MEDFFCDGDAAPLGRMNYVYQNYIPGVTNVSYPELETTAPETDPVTEPDTQAPDTQAPDTTESETPAETETEPQKGCSSVVTAGFLGLLALTASIVCVKRKD